MNIFANNRRMISEIINRVMNCRERNQLDTYGRTWEELRYLYPLIEKRRLAHLEDSRAEVVYINIDTEKELEELLPWLEQNRNKKDVILYIPSGEEVCRSYEKQLGQPHDLSGYSAYAGVLFLLGVSFDAPAEFTAPIEFKALAIVHFYNESDILAETVRYLLQQEVDIYLLDNWSNDGSYEIALKWKEKYPNRIYLERFPRTGKSDNYEWYHQLERTEQLALSMEYDWFIHYDADEMRVSPWENVTLRTALAWIDTQGYNCIENTVIDFRITDENDHIFMKDAFFDFRHEKTWFNHVKTWKKSGRIDLKTTGGHFARIPSPKPYPLKILNRHYAMRSLEQARKKVFQDRLPRFVKERGERGWHGQYDRFREGESLLYDSKRLLFWDANTFRKLYIPLFMECGLRWNINRKVKRIQLPEITDKRIVMYGAGAIGRRAYPKLLKKNRVVGWVDGGYQTLPEIYCTHVESPERIHRIAFDYILITVKRDDLAEEITNELITKYQVPRHKILYC